MTRRNPVEKDEAQAATNEPAPLKHIAPVEEVTYMLFQHDVGHTVPQCNQNKDRTWSLPDIALLMFLAAARAREVGHE